MLNSAETSTICTACPRECGVDKVIENGVCGVGKLRIARSGFHYGEEPIISGENGSGTIFFSGCNLRCVYCQNYEVSTMAKGVNITINNLVEIIKKIEGEGANNINLVTPSHYHNEIMKTLDIYKPNIPICYNTSSYDKVQSIYQLKDYVDIYLADLKYMQNDTAKTLSKAENYPQIATSALLSMRDTVGEDVVENGLMKKGLIVRHLVLPNYMDNSKKVIDWIVENLGIDTYISIMSQYVPCGEAVNIKELNRTLKPLEYKLITNYAIKNKLNNVFFQELTSGDVKYIPEFFGDSNKEI